MTDVLRRLMDNMARLRGPQGCPWNREQTHISLVPYLIEEAHEVVDAIEQGHSASLKEELGDLLLQVVFHAQIATEEGKFTIEDVFNGCAEKLERRHPHVFGPTSDRVTTVQEVAARWETIKQEERGGAVGPSLLERVPRGLPVLATAHQVQSRAARVGFDWTRRDDVFLKLQEELGELQEALRGADRGRVRDELGDLLFTVVNLARLLKIDAESALRGTVSRFSARFAHMERAAGNESLREMSPGELDRLWEAAKADEAPPPSSGRAGDGLE
ncbi:MAG: nucleoside triphosphate pyrophosphohydrolase [Nitrospirae bacterium]|nr:nucleoside triphosphate pyrophosphohydrolase [Nitrospirota bacterium]